MLIRNWNFIKQYEKLQNPYWNQTFVENLIYRPKVQINLNKPNIPILSIFQTTEVYKNWVKPVKWGTWVEDQSMIQPERIIGWPNSTAYNITSQTQRKCKQF